MPNPAWALPTSLLARSSDTHHVAFNITAIAGVRDVIQVGFKVEHFGMREMSLQRKNIR